jgi:hypothetical protein
MKEYNKPSGQAKTISEKFIDQLYSLEAVLTDEKGNKTELQKTGFLGLLAAGYKGTALIRKLRGQTHLYARFTKVTEETN